MGKNKRKPEYKIRDCVLFINRWGDVKAGYIEEITRKEFPYLYAINVYNFDIDNYEVPEVSILFTYGKLK